MKPSDFTTKEDFKDFCNKEFPNQLIAWESNYCFVQAGKHMRDNLHYEFLNDFVHLHIEGNKKAWRGMRDYLCSHSPYAKIRASRWGRNYCAWTLSHRIENTKDFYDAFIEIRDILEYHIRNYEKELGVQIAEKTRVANNRLRSSIVTVKELLNESLRIPMYQRPYRWEIKNVRQLLNDIEDSRNASKLSYRIGSVILHVDGNSLDIVDGQQRITTILLILKASGIEIGVEQLKYNHPDSITHIKENYSDINEWLNEYVRQNRTDLANYILEKCEFVKIVVTNRSEAFQMFDSQNGRGKELEAYNLLKAYHISAMEQNSQEEKIDCDIRWEAATQYNVSPNITDYCDILKQLFDEQLYRSRRWTRFEKAGRFSKKKKDEFEGFTIDKNHPTIFPYQNPQLLQYLTAKFYMSTLKGTIATSNRFEHGDSDNINPFVNINQTIVNGKSFFEYVETYVELYKRLFLNLGSYQLGEFKRFYYLYCLDYDCDKNNVEQNIKNRLSYFAKGGARRTGDGYLRELYKSLILVLFDKFGEKGLNKYYAILYRLVYINRLKYRQVKYSKVDSLPHEYFAIISQAKDMADLTKLKRLLNNRGEGNIVYDNISKRVKKFITDGSYE